MDHLIVLEAEQGRRCAKLYTAAEEHQYNAGTHFRLERRPVENIFDVASVLQEIEHDSRRMVVRGDVLDEASAKLVQFEDEAEHGPAFRQGFWRRKGPVFSDVPRHWIMLDVDSKEVGQDYLANPESAALSFISKHLPACFHGKSFYWHLSSGAGIKPGLRIHLWFWLKNAYDSETLRNWAKTVPSIDTAVFRAIQPHYTSNPMFKGRPDPVRLRSGVFDAMDDEVELDVDAVAPATSATAGPTTRNDDDDFAGLLDAPKVGLTIDEAARYLDRLDKEKPEAVADHDLWLKVGMALAHEFNKSDEALDLWEGWSAKSEKFDAKDLMYRWKSFSVKGEVGKVTTMGSIIKMAGGRLSDMADLEQRIAATEKLEPMLELLRDASFEIVAQRDLAINMAHKQLKKSGVDISLPDFRKAVKAARAEKARDTKAMAAAWAPLFKDWCYVVADKEFVNIVTGARMDKEGANDYWIRGMAENGMVGEEFDGVMPVRIFMEEVNAKQVQAAEFLPGADRYYMRSGVHYLNTWTDSRIEPDFSPDAIRAGKRFVDHILKLVPNREEAELVLDYLAAMVLCPGRKFRWALVLKGEYGNGKTAIAEAIRSVMGGRNIAVPENEQLDERYTDWFDGSQIVIIEELMSDDKVSLENKLKTFVANDIVTIRPFGKKARKAPNRTNFIMFTNHDNGAKINPGDRRYFVVETSSELAMAPAEYYNELYDNGIRKYPGGILAALMEREEDLDRFLLLSQGRAPMTKAKADMMYAGLCSEAQIINDADPGTVFEHGLVTTSMAVNQLRDLVGPSGGLHRVTPKNVSRWLHDAGWRRVKAFDTDEKGVAVKVGTMTRRHKLWAPADRVGLVSSKPRELILEFVKEACNEGFGEPEKVAKKVTSRLSVVPDFDYDL